MRTEYRYKFIHIYVKVGHQQLDLYSLFNRTQCCYQHMFLIDMLFRKYELNFFHNIQVYRKKDIFVTKAKHINHLNIRICIILFLH